MKKNWQAPRIQVQEFEANEYVAACYSLYCAISGDGKGNVTCGAAGAIDNYEGFTRPWGGFTYTSDGKPHGKPCALGTSYNADKGEFYEYGKLSNASDIHISNEVQSDGSQCAIWTSHDVNGTGDYNHYGYAVLDDGNRPNHS